MCNWGLTTIVLLLGCGSYALGEWSVWTNWTSCSVSCGDGTRNRTRQCETDVQSNVSCPGEEIESMACNVTKCTDTDEDYSGNINIGIVVGGVLSVLIIVAIIVTRHCRCGKGSRRFHPHESKDNIIKETIEDTVDSALEYHNETQFEPSFITEIATDTGDKYVYVDPTQVYYKQNTTFNEENSSENTTNIKDADQTSLHLEHHNGEVVNNPIFEDQSDINDNIVSNGLHNGLFLHSPHLQTLMDKPVQEDDGNEPDIEMYMVQKDIQEEDVDGDDIGQHSLSDGDDDDTTSENELDSMPEENHKENVDNKNGDNASNSGHHGNNELADPEIEETFKEEVEEEEEEEDPVFIDPFDALDLMQRASPYLFGDDDIDVVLAEIIEVDGIIMEDIIEVDDESFSDNESDVNSQEDDTETECNTDTQDSDDTVHESDGDSDAGASSVGVVEDYTDSSDSGTLSSRS